VPDLLLLGFGHVSRRFVGLLGERRASLAAAFDLEPKIVGIATARHGVAYDPGGIDPDRVLSLWRRGESLAALDASGTPPSDGLELIATAASDPGATAPRVVIEATPLNIVDARPAVDYIRLALLSRLHVVSANKGPVALAYRELRDLARKMGVRYLFEGAVMDGIPIFNLVRETMPACEVLGFRGVINSTTNYILTMLEEGGEFTGALAAMQEQGIAEADASLDVDGWDAAAKTAALANVLMDGNLTPQGIERTGIGQVTGDAVRAAMARGTRIRLVATARREPDGVRGRVAPEELAPDDPLALLRGMSNALYLETDLLGRVGITQLDGGLTQTAYALLSDLVTVHRGPAPREALQDRSL
jgi:homoserine dehydrogenase